MSIFSGVLGIIGGAAISHFQYDVTLAAFKSDALQMLNLKDVYVGVFKSVVFGGIIGVVGCTQGLLTRGGATGVGNATRRAVVITFLLCLVIGYQITWFFFSYLKDW